MFKKTSTRKQELKERNKATRRQNNQVSTSYPFPRREKIFSWLYQEHGYNGLMM